MRSSGPGMKTMRFLVAAVAVLALHAVATSWMPASADDAVRVGPPWEALLWGGELVIGQPCAADGFDLAAVLAGQGGLSADRQERVRIEERFDRGPVPGFFSEPAPAALTSGYNFPELPARSPFHSLHLKNIPPLYATPKLEGEGVWQSKDTPSSGNGWPAFHTTSYRPSVQFATAIVHMLLLDMKQMSMRLYIGSAEPGAGEALSQVEPENKPNLLAITNALWKAKHSGGGGAIFRGKVLTDMAPGMATIVVYKDDRVDIVEWDDSIPVSDVLDARQLKHLIVKDGRVVDSVVKHGQRTDAEIGMGMLLDEEQPVFRGFAGPSQMNVTSGDYWYIATRSAFGIRPDGNLVFAAGHHISTKDLAKALALAGCVRAIHADANPDNVLGNLYFTDREGRLVRKAKLSPEQKDDTLNRYLDRSYTSDFFAFYRRFN
ncbi:MAG: hypothetical protein AB1646_12830 [Thermodesulfobacteriota bacterium]